MKSVFVAVVMSLFVTIPVFARFTISGTVKESAQGNSLPGANVAIRDTYMGTHTGSDGSFVFRNVRVGNYTLVVSYMGYETAYYDLEVTGDTSVEIVLDQQAQMGQEVIVTATRADQRTPGTRTDISSDQIRARNQGQDVPFLLKLTPSLITSSDAGTGIGYTWMNIRGSDNSRINVTINGIPVNDAESHGVWWVNMPDIANSTESIQIQRGVGSSTQGAAAFGANISLQTTQLIDNPYSEVESGAGSFNTFRNSARFGTGLINGSWAFDGRLSRITSDGFIDRASSDLRSFYLSGGYYGDNTSVKAIIFSGREVTYQAWDGVPSHMLESNRTYNPLGRFTDAQGNVQYYDNETDNYGQDHYQLHLTSRLLPELVLNTSLHYTRGLGYYEQFRENDRLSRYGLNNITIDTTEFSRTDLIRQRWLDNHFYGATYSLNYQDFDRLQAVLGGGYNIYDGDHYGKIIWARIATEFEKNHRYYDNEARKQDFNSFLKVNYEIANGLYVHGDLQYRHIVYDFEGLAMVNNDVVPVDQRAIFNFWNPKAGFVYEVDASNRVSVFAGISNREPVRRDFTQSSPNSRPRHETLRNLEVGYSHTTSDFMAGVNFYLMDYTDQLVLTGEINDVGGFTRINIEESYRMGVELEGGWRMHQLAAIAGNLTLSRNKIPEFTEFSDLYDENWNQIGVHEKTYTDTDIAFSPSAVAAAQLDVFPFAGATVSLTGKYVSSQFIDNTMSSDRMLDAYLTNDLRLSYRFGSGIFSEIEVHFSVINLFDVDYITNAWVYKGVVGDSGLTSISDGYFAQAGRHFLGGLRLRI